MNALSYTPFIAAPDVLPSAGRRPSSLATLTVREICDLAGIRPRATSPHTPRVELHSGSRHFRTPGAYYVGIRRRAFSRGPKDALRILEVLAHGFHDYVARESICGRGLFVAPSPRGRPPLRGRPMTAAERMRRMRLRSTSSRRS